MIHPSPEWPARRASALAAAAVLTLAAALTLAGAATAQEPATPPEDPVPAGVEQLMPRGGIPAIFDPVFVAADAAHLPDDAWVLGVAVGEEARAYSLNLLNQHEVVNDRVGGVDLAAVW